MNQLIDEFLTQDRFAVVGASTNREKYGNKVLRAYQQNGRSVVPINPRADEIEGLATKASLTALERPETYAVSIITPPAITEKVLIEAAELGIKNLWLQPGSESPEVLARAEDLGLSVIAGGPCLLVVIGFQS